MSNESILRQQMKPLQFIRFLYSALMNGNGSNKDPKEYDEEFIFLLTKSGYSDCDDRVAFCVQLINWIENSEFLNTTTKEFIKYNGGKGMKSFFEDRNRRIIRHNTYRDENEIEIPVENINTCISRVTADVKKLESIMDDEIYNNIFLNPDSSAWKSYKRNFLVQSSKCRFMSVNIKDFGFEIPTNKFTTTAPSDDIFRDMLNIMSMYSKSSREKLFSEIPESSWGYLLYLCSVKPQKRKDIENYDLVQKVINGEYAEISKDIIEQSEVVTKDEELRQLEEELVNKEKELEKKERELQILIDRYNTKVEELGNNETGNEENNVKPDGGELRAIQNIVNNLRKVLNGPEEEKEVKLEKLCSTLEMMLSKQQ